MPAKKASKTTGRLIGETPCRGSLRLVAGVRATRAGWKDKFWFVSRSHCARRRSSTTCSLAVAVFALPSIGCGGDAEERAKITGALRITVSELSPNRARYSAPRSIPAGLTRITLKNEGEEPHKAQLVRIEGNHSIAEARRARRPFPRWLYTEGGVGMTEPGKTDSVIQRLNPGRYYITGTYGEKGRVAPLRVVGKRSSATLPATSGSIVANEYSFIASGLQAGNNTLEFGNDGFEPHHAVVAAVKPGRSVGELRRSLRGRGAIPVGKIVDLKNAQETAVLERGQKQVVRLRLEPRKYALLCFVPDRRGGPAHVVKGMVDGVTVR